MVTVSNIIENKKVIAELFIQQGFKSPIFFKGFSKSEEHNLNLHLEDENIGSDVLRYQFCNSFVLKDKIEALLGCEIVMTVGNGMAHSFRKKLDFPGASVKSTVDEFQNDTQTFKEKMLVVFGENWIFNTSKSSFHSDYFKYFNDAPIESHRSKKRTIFESFDVDKDNALSPSLFNTVFVQREFNK